MPHNNKNLLIPCIPSGLVFLLLILSPLIQCKSKTKQNTTPPFEYITLLGDTVYTPENPPREMIDKYEKAKADFEANPDDIDHIIWYGRRTAYLGRFNEAINIYSEGIKKIPDEPRLYRHRGHRYISTRQHDKAINDLKEASQLIEGSEDQIEPDGLPNAQNIPVSTLHGNIYYHLGLAHYLSGDYDKALDAYLQSMQVSNNNDMIVSTAHWLYMTYRKLGMNEGATKVLNNITPDMDIIENQSYHQLCLFYQGLVPEETLAQPDSPSSSNDAALYGLGNYHLLEGNKEKAKSYFDRIIDNGVTASFGYLAAERDLMNFF